MIQVGETFPNFSLLDQDGKTHTLANYKGKWLVVYFYPKDDTPGCTIQGKSFTASKTQFDQANTVILGVSQDDVESHKNFCNKFGFNITLLADTSASLMNALGLAQNEYKGVFYWDRSTVVVDPQGKVRKVYSSVKPQDHEMHLLEDLKTLQNA